MRNLQEHVKKALCYQKLFWTFTVWINCYSELNFFANSRPSTSNFKSFSWSLEHFFFLTVGQNNFGNKIPFLTCFCSQEKSNQFFFSYIYESQLKISQREEGLSWRWFEECSFNTVLKLLWIMNFKKISRK